MNAKSVLTRSILLAASALSSAAYAQEATPDSWTTAVQSQRSVAEVRAEAARLLRSGELARRYGEGALPQMSGSGSRAVVIAELQRARQSGELAALGAEAHAFGAVPRGHLIASQ